MQSRVVQTVFERTDFGSFGWLKEGPATPAYETAFFAATEAATRSFMSGDKVKLSTLLTDFGSFGWIFTAESGAFDPALFVAVGALAKSFRAGERAGLPAVRTDFGSFGWLKEGPATPAYEVAFFAGTDAQAKASFRTDKRKGMPFVDTDFGSLAWIFTALAVFDPVNFVAIDSMAKSFRAGDGARLDPRLTDYGSFGWINEGPATPAYETAFFAGTDAQAKASFRTAERKGMPFVDTDFGSFGWIITALVVFDPVNFVAIDSMAKSFRAGDGARLDPRLTDYGSFGWLKTGSDTPVYSIEFFTSIDALTKSYRVGERAGLPAVRTDYGSFGWLKTGSETAPPPSLAGERRIFTLDTDRRVFTIDTERRIFTTDTERRVFDVD